MFVSFLRTDTLWSFLFYFPNYISSHLESPSGPFCDIVRSLDFVIAVRVIHVLLELRFRFFFCPLRGVHACPMFVGNWACITPPLRLAFSGAVQLIRFLYLMIK